MKTFKIVLIVVISVLIFIAAILFAIGFFQPKPGGIRINTSSPASVYINGTLIGKTPYSGTHETGEISLKIVPDSSSGPLFPYETKLTLSPGVETVVDRDFGASEEKSAGDVIYFEKESGGETSLAVISTPDNAQISLDGVVRGFTPYKTATISPAQHKILIKAAGYEDRTVDVKVVSGYRLNVFVKLAKSDEVQASPTPTPQVKTYIEIQNTPTGFLRVRTEPGSSGQEIAQVKPGERYLFLDEDVATGWFKIQYQDPAPGLPNGITGWVSNEYSKKIEAGTETSTPSASLNSAY